MNFKLKKTLNPFSDELALKLFFMRTLLILIIVTFFNALTLVNPPGFLLKDNFLLLIFLLTNVVMTFLKLISTVNCPTLTCLKTNGLLSAIFVLEVTLSSNPLIKVVRSSFGGPTSTERRPYVNYLMLIFIVRLIKTLLLPIRNLSKTLFFPLSPMVVFLKPLIIL